MCEILADDYQILEAENGREALDILQKHKNSIALIPVIVMTQSESEEDEVTALAHGATDFVPKPYRPQVILHRVANLIRLRENAAMVNQFQYDRLTGLYSKEFFCQKVRERLLEDPEREYNIICFNIENFKLYNDTFGRDAGDQLLKMPADIARDMVGSTGFCGRFGAD